MTQEIRFAHVNLVASDWRRLASFYGGVFGCVPVGAKRDLSGPWLDRAVAIPGARVRGIHLALPGSGPEGLTLEIFEYEPNESADPPAANRPGFGHVAFSVEDVEAMHQQVLDAGGSALGEIVTKSIPGEGSITFAYLRDPEGNILEIQHWTPA